MSGCRDVPGRWSRSQRWIHWALVAALLLGWWSGDRDADWHDVVGYTAMGLLAVRVLIGFGRHPHVRWAYFLRQLAALPRYLAGRPVAPAPLSPAGAFSALVLLVLMGTTAVTGWMLTLEDFVGEEGAEWRHEWAFNLLLGWVGVHAVVAMTQRLRSFRAARG